MPATRRPSSTRSSKIDRTGGPRTGQKRTLMGAISELPNFLRLLYGLLTDPRVDPIDKLLVGGAVAYVITPIEWIPDFIPLIGEIDEVFILVFALRHLLQHTDREVLQDHWMGDPDELDDLNLRRILSASSFFLPRRVRRRLRTIGRM
jgi:uncharacterized membrane protein YkvA (DUF1232 family)